MDEPVVLVVDDEPGIIQLCRRLLERSNFQVLTTSQPVEAISILHSKPISLLLVDIRMPEMDGFQLIELAHLQRPDLAIVVMTGYGTVETAIEALRRGADGLVLKPFSNRDLVQSVRSALEESQHKQDILRLQTLRPLFQLSESLFAQTDPRYLEDMLIDVVCEYLHCSYMGLYKLENTASTFHLIASQGALTSEECNDPEKSLLGRVLLNRAATLINHDSVSDLVDLVYLEENQLSSLLCASLSSRREEYVLLAARKEGERSFRAPDLEFFSILARQAAVALENAHLHAALLDNIRQIEESQRALIQAEKLAIAGRLTASIAHEVNNPLQSLRNCLHLARHKEISSKTRQDYLELAQSELERLAAIVQRMLDYYRPSGVDRKAVDVNDLVRRVITLLEKQLRDREILIETHLASSLPSIMAVGDQIQQVLLNLVLNSMEAMPEGGQITIETGVDNRYIQVLVKDNGPGVSPNQRERIFEPFVSSKDKGTGLGLAISYGIISAHGGSLELIEQDSGACFRIILPCEDIEGTL